MILEIRINFREIIAYNIILILVGIISDTIKICFWILNFQFTKSGRILLLYIIYVTVFPFNGDELP